MENTKNIFYEQFEFLCYKEHIKPSALARKLNMSPSAPGRWKNGSNPDLDTVARIAEYFGVSIDFLIRGEDTQAGNTETNISNSAVMQGNSNSGNVSVSNGSAPAGIELTDQESEVLRIFRALDMRKKNTVLTYLYEVEDQAKG